MGILLFIDYWKWSSSRLFLLTDKDKQPLSVFISEINSERSESHLRLRSSL
jgi:hypothetical protein